jgi:kynurenine--oxoglutarate transaminase/cysteine-S-conjugate beta-lyase/glutamine--phenylpyruvate transaminase
LNGAEAEEEDGEMISLVDMTDRAPCFDNGVCLSFPDDDDAAEIIETIMDNTVLKTGGDVTIEFTDTDDVATISNRNAINSNKHASPKAVVDEARGSVVGSGGGGGAIQRLGGTATGPTVWSEFGRLAAEHSQSNNNFSNLGQGFPDWLPPEFAVQSLVSAALDTTSSSPHQYTRTAGHPNLVKQLAKRYSKHLDRQVDPMAEVAVTVGASQALYLCLQTLVRPGDEVILFEPFFDLYVNQIKLAGGIPVYVPLTFVPFNNDGSGGGGGRWILESNKLRDKISSTKTRAIILNSPHNPTGKVFTHSEMLDVAQIVTEVAGPQCVVLSDEVYKYIVHSPPRDVDTNGNNDHEKSALQEGDVGNISLNGSISSSSSSNNNTKRTTSSCPGHVHFASLPNMWERTITISSAGKTFSATGWQVGWCIGPTHLISPIHQLLPYVQFCASTVIQEALARTLPRADEAYEGYASYYEYLNEKYRRKRDLLSKALQDVGFAVPDYDATPGWGGFFIFAQITPEVRRALPLHRLQMPHCANPAAPGGKARLDWALCQWMVEELGVLCIPSSPFFSMERALEGASDEFIRVAFCKTDETIERAALSLRKLALYARENNGGQDDVLDDDTDIASDKEKDVVAAAMGGLS